MCLVLLLVWPPKQSQSMYLVVHRVTAQSNRCSKRDHVVIGWRDMQLADNWSTHVVPCNHAIHMDGFCFLECVNMSMQCMCHHHHHVEIMLQTFPNVRQCQFTDHRGSSLHLLAIEKGSVSFSMNKFYKRVNSFQL